MDDSQITFNSILNTTLSKTINLNAGVTYQNLTSENYGNMLDLLGGTGFIPVGKYNTYGFLRDIGFKFNYDFDISWDNEPKDLTRFENLVKLIYKLNKMSAQEIFDCTKHSSEFNQDYIYSGDFYKFCETQNQKVINDLT